MINLRASAMLPIFIVAVASVLVSACGSEQNEGTELVDDSIAAVVDTDEPVKVEQVDPSDMFDLASRMSCENVSYLVTLTRERISACKRELLEQANEPIDAQNYEMISHNLDIKHIGCVLEATEYETNASGDQPAWNNIENLGNPNNWVAWSLMPASRLFPSFQKYFRCMGINLEFLEYSATSDAEILNDQQLVTARCMLEKAENNLDTLVEYTVLNAFVQAVFPELRHGEHSSITRMLPLAESITTDSFESVEELTRRGAGVDYLRTTSTNILETFAECEPPETIDDINLLIETVRNIDEQVNG